MAFAVCVLFLNGLGACLKFADKGLKEELVAGDMSLEIPAGWRFYGPTDGQPPYDFIGGTDSEIKRGGNYSAGFFAIEVSRDDQARLTQRFLSERYNGKRVRFSGYVKTYMVSEWAGLWMRIDTASKQSYAFDDMEDRPVSGTVDWTRLEVVLDVPDNAVTIYFGLHMFGRGQVWLDDCKFEIVGNEVPVTNQNRLLGGHKRRFSIPEFLPNEPVNLDFEEENLFE
jgi:hypothetical protein